MNVDGSFDWRMKLQDEVKSQGVKEIEASIISSMNSVSKLVYPAACVLKL